MAGILVFLAVLCSCTTQISTRIVIEPGKPEIIAVPPDEVLEIEVTGIPLTTSYAVFQAHSQRVELNISGSENWTYSESKSGYNAGVLTLLESVDNETSITYYLTTFDTPVNATKETEVMIMAKVYDATVPFVGGCNMEFSAENDPNVLIEQKDSFHKIHFAWANVPVKHAKPESCEASTKKNLTYELYARYLYANNMDQKYFFREVRKLLTTKHISHHATKIKDYKWKDKTVESLASFPRRGVIYVAVVSYKSAKGVTTSAAYVPSVSYGCRFVEGESDSCIHPKKNSMAVLVILAAVYGFLICFFGHRFFKCSVFYFGFMAFGLISYIMIARFTALPDDGLIWLGFFLGVVGGCLWLLFWIMAGIPVLTVLLGGLVFGYLFSSLVFTFTPLDRLPVLLTPLNYGMSFACGVLIIPVLLLYFTHKLSIMSSAVVGSFWTTMGVCIYLEANLIYAFLHTLHKATIPEFIGVSVYMPLEKEDIFLLILWLAMAVLGTAFQIYRERERPQFPPCPYTLYKQQNELPVPINESQENGGYESFTERSPLLPNRTPQPERQPIVDPI